jgi:hypothetical protein
MEAMAIPLPRSLPMYLAMDVTDAKLVSPWPNWRNRNLEIVRINIVGA